MYTLLITTFVNCRGWFELDDCSSFQQSFVTKSHPFSTFESGWKFTKLNKNCIQANGYEKCTYQWLSMSTNENESCLRYTIPYCTVCTLQISAGLLLLHKWYLAEQAPPMEKRMHRDDGLTSTGLVESYLGWHFCRLLQLFCGFDDYLGFRCHHWEVVNRFAWSHRRENDISKRLNNLTSH